MPMFEFECNKCRTQFEELVASTARPLPECPECNENDVRKLISLGSIRGNGISKMAEVGPLALKVTSPLKTNNLPTSVVTPEVSVTS